MPGLDWTRVKRQTLIDVAQSALGLQAVRREMPDNHGAHRLLELALGMDLERLCLEANPPCRSSERA
jgi:hypothetical protein